MAPRGHARRILEQWKGSPVLFPALSSGLRLPQETSLMEPTAKTLLEKTLLLVNSLRNLSGPETGSHPWYGLYLLSSNINKNPQTNTRKGGNPHIFLILLFQQGTLAAPFSSSILESYSFPFSLSV